MNRRYSGLGGNDKTPLSQATYVGIGTKTSTQQKQNHPHHGEHPPPPTARISWFDPIQHKREVEEWLGEGADIAIYHQEQLIGREIN